MEIVTTIRREVLTLPAALLGPDNPLPPLRPLDETHRIEDRDKRVLPRDMARALTIPRHRDGVPARATGWRDVTVRVAVPALARRAADDVRHLLHEPELHYASGLRLGTLALLPRPGATPARRDVGAVVSAACRLHRRPLFVYAGINGGVPLPGMLLPGRLRPSPMILQLRDFAEGAPPFAPSRFEAIDFDFA